MLLANLDTNFFGFSFGSGEYLLSSLDGRPAKVAVSMGTQFIRLSEYLGKGTLIVRLS